MQKDAEKSFTVLLDRNDTFETWEILLRVALIKGRLLTKWFYDTVPDNGWKGARA